MMEHRDHSRWTILTGPIVAPKENTDSCGLQEMNCTAFQLVDALTRNESNAMEPYKHGLA